MTLTAAEQALSILGVPLTPRLFNVANALLAADGDVVSWLEIVRAMGYAGKDESNTVKVAVSNLRKAVPDLNVTVVRRRGYRVPRPLAERRAAA